MAVEIVDRLEAVQVEIEHGRLSPHERRGRRLGQDTQELLMELNPVGQFR